MDFSDRLCLSILEKQSHIAVGLDPVISRIPLMIKEKHIEKYGKSPQAAASAILEFNQLILDQVADHVAVVKPQLAYYEIYGSHGIEAYNETVKYARAKGLITIADAKRDDIASTSEAYATAFLGAVDEEGDCWQNTDHLVDSLTVNAYLGSDSIEPFVNVCKKKNKGIFVLVKTSNPSSGELQDKVLADGQTVSTLIANKVTHLGSSVVGETYGYSSIGAVVGATFPEDLKTFRTLMPTTIFLVPGFGVQGGTVHDVVHAFNQDGFGALISASRNIIYSYESMTNPSMHEIKGCLQETVKTMNDKINTTLRDAGKLHWEK